MPKPTTTGAYLKSLPAERREALEAVRKTINDNLDSGYQEAMQYGMPSWSVPHSVYPNGYHCDPKQPLPYIGLASQKNHMAIYAFCVYTDEKTQKWFVDAWKKTGKKLDMGKSCIRFKNLEDVPLDVVAELIRRTPADAFIAGYEGAISAPRPARKKTAKKTTKKKASGKKAASKKKTAKKKAAASKATKKKAPTARKATKKKAAKKRTAAR